MDSNDRQAIAGLFDRLAQAGDRMPQRDPEAERLIAEGIARQPGAPYYLAQTVLAQEHALAAARDRIGALEAALAAARREAEGGFLADLFGGGPAPRTPAPPARPLPQGAPGGFLSGAMQTAMGVAGGLLLADALAGLAGGAAQAAEPGDDAGFGDDGGW